MEYLNKYKLPDPLVAAISGDKYHEKRKEQLEAYCLANRLDPKTTHFSVSDLIRPPRMRVLAKRYHHKIVKDASQDIFRVLGQAIHSYLRQNEVEGYVLEERLFTHLNIDDTPVIISGEPDLVTPEGEIHDYKVVAVFSWQKAVEEGVKTEYEQQLNLYAFLRQAQRKPTTGLKNIFILRDFNLQSTVREDYPKAGVQVLSVPLWTLETQVAYVMERIKLHMKAENAFDNELEECTPDEMWEKPEMWAIRKEGANRAYKLIRTPGQEGRTQAQAITLALNDKCKDEKECYAVEHRPGERTRCEKFCDSSSFCNLYSEYKSVKFK